MPRQAGGISTTHPGLVYLGLEFQRSFSSNTLRGVGRDATHAITALAEGVSGGTPHRPWLTEWGSVRR
jgi:hypothetical protein